MEGGRNGGKRDVVGRRRGGAAPLMAEQCCAQNEILKTCKSRNELKYPHFNIQTLPLGETE